MLAPELTGEQARGSAQRKGKWADHPPRFHFSNRTRTPSPEGSLSQSRVARAGFAVSPCRDGGVGRSATRQATWLLQDHGGAACPLALSSPGNVFPGTTCFPSRKSTGQGHRRDTTT